MSKSIHSILRHLKIKKEQKSKKYRTKKNPKMESLEKQWLVGCVYRKIAKDFDVPHILVDVVAFASDWKERRRMFERDTTNASNFPWESGSGFLRTFVQYYADFQLLNDLNRTIFCRALSRVPCERTHYLCSDEQREFVHRAFHALIPLPFSDPLSRSMYYVYTSGWTYRRFGRREIPQFAMEYTRLVEEGIRIDSVHPDVENILNAKGEQGGLDATLKLSPTGSSPLDIFFYIRIPSDFPFRFPRFELKAPVPEPFRPLVGRPLPLDRIYDGHLCTGVLDVLRSLKLDFTLWLEGENDLYAIGLPKLVLGGSVSLGDGATQTTDDPKKTRGT